MAIERVFAFHRRCYDGFLPENLSIAAIQAEKDPRLFRRDGRNRKNAIIPNNSRGMAEAG